MQNKTLENLISHPAEIVELLKNPGKFGIDVYNDLSLKQKQYALFAAGAGLIVYAIYLGKKER